MAVAQDPSADGRGGTGATTPDTGIWLFDFSVGRWTWREKITGIAMIVLLVSLCQPWFYLTGLGTTASSPASVMSTHAWLWAAFVMAVGALVLLVVGACFSQPAMRAARSGYRQLVAIAATTCLVLVVLAFILAYGQAQYSPSLTVTTLSVHCHLSALIALLAAFTATAFTVTPIASSWTKEVK
jgi:hypothetical protein